MKPKRGEPTRLVVGVLALASLLVGVGSFLLLVVVDRSARLPLDLPPWVAFIGLLIAGMAPLMLEVQRNTFALSLTEIPIVLCLLSMQRVPLVIAGTSGWIVALLLSRRRSPLKLLLNVSVMFFEITVSAALLDATVRSVSLTSWTTWAGVLLGISTAIFISSNVINVVISIAGDPITPRQALRHAFLGVMNGATSAIFTLLVLMAYGMAVVAVVPVALLGAASLLPMRRSAKLQRRYDGLLLLHEFTAGLTGSTDLNSTVQNVLTETSKVLRTSNATIVLLRDGEPFRLSLDTESGAIPRVGDAIWNEVIDNGSAVCLKRGSSDHDNYLESHAIRDLMAVPLMHSDTLIGALVVTGRLGESSTFDADDLSIFGTMANQTTVTLENLRLIDRLRDESAEREHQALHDELTGLPNRAHLYATLDKRLAEGPLAVAMVDLNRFKEVNDTLGHHAGDEVLIQTAKRLRQAMPSSALVARLGGDEFAIVLFGCSLISDAVAKLSSLELAFAQPIELEAMSLRVDASIGVAVSPLHGTDHGSLLRRADIAMYAAKQVRGTTVRAYERSQERSSKRSLEIVGELRKAIETDTIDVAYQPQASLATGRIVGVEALARWTHPTLGRIGPDEFVPLAEQAGLTEGLTNHILRRALRACATWKSQGVDLTVAINVDAQTFLGPHFVNGTLAALAAAGIEAKRLTVEITERELLRELDAATAVIDRLRHEGVSMSIDDFGTGYSSLAYLARLPVDEVKIDRAFVSEVLHSPVHRAIVRAISEISATMGASTVVEGIEDQATWNEISSLGCTYAQGYFLAKPMPERDLVTWLNTRTPIATVLV